MQKNTLRARTIRRVGYVMIAMFRDCIRFLYWNIRHYSFAIWGFNLKLDPDYPPVTRFFPSLIYDTVFEYRTYGLMPLVSVLIIGIGSLSEPAAWALVLLWAIQSFQRSTVFRSNLAYWEQAYRESPAKHRTRTFYAEWCIRESLEAWKCGDHDFAMNLEKEAWRVQDEICGKPFEMPKGQIRD